MNRHAWLKSSVALAVTLAASSANANGLSINEQSASGMGTGFAGRSSSAEDASTLFGNPAGMSRLDRTEISGGFATIFASTDISDAQGALPGSNDGDMVPNAVVPFGYLVSPLNDRWHAGFGVYAPFGVISDYEKGFQGRYHSLYSKVQVITLQPTLSYQVNDWVSVGFGPTINQIKGKLTRNSPHFTAPGVGPDTNVNVRGDDIGYGFNAGVLVDLTEQLRWGLTYHSKVDYTLEGRTRVAESVLPGLNGSYDASLDFTSPESIDTSITWEMDPRWTLYAGATWTRWSRLDKIVIKNEGVNPAYQGHIGAIEEDMQWDDILSWAIGASYQLTPQWVLRAGFTSDPSPTNDTHRTVRVPVSDRQIFSLGAGWDITPDLTLDVAYSYLYESKGEINTSDYTAEFQNSAHGLATQATWRF
ncbi:OmpP1/FadL family transporter [Halopseudomonas maritima]|uniref:OmpP1/FadL family transporter n=1 Tax=Halopseudomonas maritima TaxID=2918528 RepID=UPI001EEBCD03|nr:outer membrane protein transport protein [Halopseudomonas maritima]UJJ31611.1 outer membrane protein transport protein [Halopseudomonas maritima]